MHHVCRSGRSLLVALVTLSLAAPAAAGKAITPADIMTLDDTRAAEISPDGKTILFAVQRQMSTFSPDRSTIWSVPADGGAPARRLIVSAGTDTSPRWSPDGRTVAFLSNRKNPLAGGADTGFAFKPDTAAAPSRQIWQIATHGGEPAPLTALPNDVVDFAWSPDGKRIAFLSADPDSAAEKADKAAKRDWIVVDRPRNFTRLWILDLASRIARRVSPAGLNINGLDWSPDGRRLALSVADTPGINDYFYHSRIVLFDPATGVVGRTMLDHAAGAPRWSPDGRAILASEVLTPGFVSLGARVVDVVTGAVQKPGDDHPGLLTEPRWAPDSRSIVALSFEKTRSNLVRLDPRTGEVTRLAALDGEAAGLSLSDDGRRMALALSAPTRPADIWTVAGGKPKAVTRLNPQVADWALGAVSEISWQNREDGRTIYGVLVLPPGYVAGTPTKTVVQIHGGPEWAWWAGWLGSWHEWAQMLASHGYVVLLPNIRGSDGQGTAFARAIGDDWGGMDYRDMLDGVDMLVARKIADPARLGIGGWSYGGFLAAWAITHDARFKAAVVGAGPANLGVMARITDTPDFTLGYYGDVSTNQAAYDRSSPARLVERVTAPVLVLHGEADTRVPVTLGLEFYRGLNLLGKRAEMVRYPREPHWFHEPAHQEDVLRRVLGWFDAYL